MVTKMKKKSSHRFLLAVLMFIPLAFIVYFFVSFTSGSISADNVDKVKIILPDGKEFEFDDKDSVSLYVDAVLDSLPVDEPVRDLSGERPSVIEFIQSGRTISYNFYPELNASGCMLYSQDGKYSVLSGDNARKVLSRSECGYLYEGNLLPTLSVVSGENEIIVNPVSYSWVYKTMSGDSVDYTETPAYVESGSVFVFASRENDFSFSAQPTAMNVSFYNEYGALLPYSSLSSLIFENDTSVTVVIDARWDDSGSGDKYGEARYEFNLFYDVAASVVFPVRNAHPGDLLCYLVDDLNEGQTLFLDTDINTCAPRVFEANEKQFSMLPIGLDTSAGIHTLNFSSGGVTSPSALEIVESEAKIYNIETSGDAYLQAVSDENSDALIKLVNSLTDESTEEILFGLGTAFSAPVSSEPTVSFGDDILLSSGSNESTLKSYFCLYDAQSGTNISACAKGVVSFYGEIPLFGRTVAIDHGLGVISVYFGLEECSVSEGAAVSQGQIIAKSGSVAISDNMFGTAVFVNGIAVSPEFLYENGIRLE